MRPRVAPVHRQFNSDPEPPSGPRNYGARDPLEALFQARLKTSDSSGGRAKTGHNRK